MQSFVDIGTGIAADAANYYVNTGPVISRSNIIFIPYLNIMTVITVSVDKSYL